MSLKKLCQGSHHPAREWSETTERKGKTNIIKGKADVAFGNPLLEKVSKLPQH